MYLLSSSKFNFGSKFNVIICNFFPISIFELARNLNSARYSFHIGSNLNKKCICYLARNSILAGNSMSIFVSFSNYDLWAGSIFKLSSIFASHRLQFEPKMYVLSSSKFNFGSKFNVIICNVFQFRSSSWLEIQTLLDIRFT